MAKLCSVEGCKNGCFCKGLCVKHYTQIRKHGKITERTKYDPQEYTLREDICAIHIYDKHNNHKAEVWIDLEDYEKVRGYRWRLNGDGRVFHGKRFKALSRLIMGVTDPKIQVDHINHNLLDNRKENLRICTGAENTRNMQRLKRNTSGYKGVSWDKNRKKWTAYIHKNNKQIYLGRYQTKEQAAEIYNEAAIKYHGEFACLNEISQKESVARS
jgi:hypothetical protein